jgi:prepilin-type N-terminal cleavage/methylation domain-containing protein
MNRAFTLIEFLIVICIVGIIFAIIMGSISPGEYNSISSSGEFIILKGDNASLAVNKKSVEIEKISDKKTRITIRNGSNLYKIVDIDLPIEHVMSIVSNAKTEKE